MIWLHRGNHLFRTETWDFARPQMLRVFDAATAVARAVLLGDFLIYIQNLLVRLIADGVRDELQPDAIRLQRAFEHDAFRKHVRPRQTVIARLVGIRLKQKRRQRTEAAVRKCLQPADTQHVVARSARGCLRCPIVPHRDSGVMP